MTIFHVPVWNDYLVPAFSTRLGATAPDVVEFRGGLFLLAFNGGATTESVYFTVHFLHDITQGSLPTFHVHWTHKVASPTGDVKWQVDYSIARGYGAGTYAAPASLSAVQTAPAQYVHAITDDDDMAIASSTEIEPDSQLIGRLYRDPTDVADTFGDDAMLIGLDLHYERSQLGTAERNRPFTSAGF